MFDYSYYGYSDTGTRKCNDDVYTICEKNMVICTLIADGVGGSNNGKKAATIVSNALIRCCDLGCLPAPDDILQAMQQADMMICSSTEDMQTTAVCLYISNNRCIWAHIGDSRLYYFKDRKLKKVTLDHSLAQIAVMRGKITREEIPIFDKRNQILRAIGTGEAEPSFDGVDLANGHNAFLLCSDGFWEYLTDYDIETSLQMSKTPEEWILQMRKILDTRKGNDRDNNTAIAVFIQSK